MSCKVYCMFNLEVACNSAYQRLRQRCELVMSQSYATREEFLEGVRGATVIVSWGYGDIDAKILDAAGPALKAVCTQSAGYNHIDLIECKKRNVRVGYLGELMAGHMAEFTIGFMIATGRKFKQEFEDLSRFGWKNSTERLVKGFQLMNSTIGLVGMGNIGVALATRLKVFAVKKILYCGPNRKPNGDALGAEYTTFENVLRESDFVVATCALTDQTRGLFNRTAFDLMKPTAIFINISRGDLVDQEDLYEALTKNKIFAAGLDAVTPEPIPQDHPLVGLENCVILPHLATHVNDVRTRMSEATVDNVLAVIEDNEKMLAQLHF